MLENHLKLRAANGFGIPFVVYIETSVCIKSEKILLKKRRILIVKDNQGREVPRLIVMNVI